MASRTVIHVLTYAHGHWQIKFNNEPQAHTIYVNRDTAIATARSLAQREAPAMLIIHLDDGLIESESTYDAQVV